MSISEDKEAELKELFQKVRDIPYGDVKDPEEMLEEGKGNCRAKNGYLSNRYRELGIPTRFVVCEFKWGDLPLPPDLGELVEGVKPSRHIYIEMKKEGKWCPVDATWDPRFKKYDFPVSKWSKEGTQIAVEPVGEERRFDSLEAADRYMSRTKKPESERERKFSKAKNRWIESLQ